MLNAMKSLQKIFHDAARRHHENRICQNLDKMVDAIEGGLTTTDQKLSCQYQRAVMNGILIKAKNLSQTEFNKDGTIQKIPLHMLKRELDALVKVASMSAFSDNLHHWVNERQNALALRLAREHTYLSMQKLWDGLDENGRLSFLRFIIETQNDIFSTEEIPLRASGIKENKQETSLATFEINFTETGYTTTIAINRKLLKGYSMTNAVTSMVHEGIHSVLRQLGALGIEGRIPKNNPLYEDAQLMMHRMQIDSYIPALFGDGYYADVEEKLCHRVHTGFMKLYYQQIDLRESNRVRIPRENKP